LKIVAQCLELICQNVEAIGNEMSRPGRLQSVTEHSQSYEDSSDGGSDDNKHVDEDLRGNTQEVPPTPPPRTDRGGSTHDRRGWSHHEKKHASGHVAVGGKENCTVFYNVLPLTYANVSCLPSMCKYV
jgi:hypothetical protein